MRLHRLDLWVIAIYLAAITAIGLLLRGRDRSLRDYFLASGELPWWAIGFSIVAAETSVLTIISTPGLAFAGDFGFLQLVFGYLVARLLIAAILIPAYFRRRLLTAYELLGSRFSPAVQRLASLLFLGGRTLAEGVRLFAIAVVVEAIIAALPAGVHAGGVGPAMVVIAALTLLYTYAGGLRAVVWTDFIQICIYLAGAGASLWMLLHGLPGGWSAVARAAAPGHKLRVFDFSFSWTRPYTFWSGMLGGTFLTLATHGTDQLMVQRLLAARTQRESQWALIGSWVVIVFQFSLFLAIGAALYATHPQTPTAGGSFGRFDRLYPDYIATHLPAGAAGLVLAAIIAAAMSNLSAALNALSSSAIVDLYRPLVAPGRSESHYLRAGRLATLGWMGMLGAVAYASRHSHSVLESGLAIISYPFSALLGAFLLGTLTQRVGTGAVVAGMGAGLGATIALSHLGVAYTWFAVAGTLITMAVGYGVSWIWA